MFRYEIDYSFKAITSHNPNPESAQKWDFDKKKTTYLRPVRGCSLECHYSYYLYDRNSYFTKLEIFYYVR